MKNLVVATNVLVVSVFGLGMLVGLAAFEPQTAQKTAAPAAAPALAPDAVDRLLAPIALYPDQLLAQMLLCAANPGKVAALGEWLGSNQSLKGAELQDAAAKSRVRRRASWRWSCSPTSST